MCIPPSHTHPCLPTQNTTDVFSLQITKLHSFNFTRLAGFCQKAEITSFAMEKTGVAKIVFAGKNRFLPEYILYYS